MSLRFYRQNSWWLGTGLVLTFASSFGQTYFIGLFADPIRAEFGLSNGAWGGLYTVATIFSATVLVQAGKLVDTMSLARLAAGILVLYAGAALLMMTAGHVIVLGVAIFGLRFCGQGMMGHIAVSAMARWFAANRARAVAVAVLGFPIGEAVFPVIAVHVEEALGWRAAWAAVAVILLGVILPAVFVLLRRGRVPQGEGAGESAVGMGGRHWTRREVLKHWSFYALLPGLLAPPFIGTCIFFHQAHIADVRGFSLATMALAFPIYAFTSISTSLTAGLVLDRIGPTRVLPFCLVPLSVSIAALALPGGVWIWFLMLVGVGISQGVVITMMGTLWPTLYGTRWIGSVKSIISASMVVATALGPGVSGIIIDEGVSFPDQALTMSAYCLGISLLFFVIAPRLRGALPAQPHPHDTPAGATP
ncbi:MAG: MFS transporter [Pseudomonadota bacterium]